MCLRFISYSLLRKRVAVGAVVTVKADGFCEGFSKPLVEIIQKKLPKATFIDFTAVAVP